MGTRGSTCSEFEISKLKFFSGSNPLFLVWAVQLALLLWPGRTASLLGCLGSFVFSISGLGGFRDCKWCCNRVVDV